MSRINRIILAVIIILIVALFAWLFYLYFSPAAPAQQSGTTSPVATTTASSTSTTTPALTPDQQAVSAAVTGFGAEEQQVELLAPDASTTMAADYGPYVLPSLLSVWEANPQSAPGRVVSTPWPDHITIGSITQTSSGYQVKGTLILMSSSSVENGGNDGTDALIIDLVSQNGAWLISKYQDESAG